MQKQRTCKLRTSLRRWHGPFYQTNRVEIKFEFSLISRSILKSIFLAHAFIFLVLPEGISQEVPSPTIKDQEQNPPKLNAAKITNTVVPGIISGIRKIYDKEKERYELLMSYLTPKTANTVSLADAQDLKINPDFITSLFFHSPSTYLLLLKNNSSSAAQECSFYSLLENGLLKTADEFSQNIVVDILFKNKSGMGKEGAIQTMSLPIGDTLEFIYKKKCPEQHQLHKQYSAKEYAKTIAALNLQIPTTEESCRKQHQEWLENPQLPYLCGFTQLFSRAQYFSQKMNSLLPRDIDKKKSYQYYIQKAKSVRGKFALSQYSFLSTLCKNLQNPQNFCDAYLSKNYFQKIINGERPMAHLQGRCQGLLNKNVLSSTDLNECLSIMQAKPQNCHFSTWKIYPSLAPSSDCNSISTALLSSRLSAEYQDCPAKIVNTAITNAHRILKHFKENPKGSDSGKKSTNTNSEVLDTKYCASESSHAIAQMILDFGSNKIWNYTLCYLDHFKNAEVCLPFALGEFPESKLSENLVIAQVLREGQGANEKLNCKLVSKKEFRPNLLEYRYGCNIVYDDNNCNALECPKTIYLNQNIVKQITEHKGANFYYLPINLKDDLLTLTYILEQSQNIKSVVINNYTQLENFFKEERHGIIHGQGCIEDILPQFFRRAALNQCRPISFIIDGVIFDQNAMAVVLRLPIDEVHSPRIVDWNFLYLSVYNYQNLHPLRLWTLYGLKK